MANVRADFENRPTAQFVKQEDFILESKDQLDAAEFVEDEYVPKYQEEIDE
jgi:hypothetical protein